MTAFFGTAIILTILACIPLTLLFAGRDTDHRNAIRRECQKDALLDWTDKDILSSLHQSPARSTLLVSPAPSSVKIESLPRTAFYSANPAA